LQQAVVKSYFILQVVPFIKQASFIGFQFLLAAEVLIGLYRQEGGIGVRL
jgi:hypothetical protein